MLLFSKMYKAVASAITVIGGGAQAAISASLRTRTAASSGLQRTVTTAGNAYVAVIDLGIRRGSLGVANSILTTTTYPAYLASQFGDGTSFRKDAISVVFGGSTTYGGCTLESLRDANDFYRVTLAIDTTQTVAANRFFIIINGVNHLGLTTVPGCSGVYPPQNTPHTLFSANQKIAFGKNIINGGNGGFGDNEYNYIRIIDGYPTGVTQANWSAATVAAALGGFSTIQPDTWLPTTYTGSYGTNGGLLTFADRSSLFTLGMDCSNPAVDKTVQSLNLFNGTNNSTVIVDQCGQNAWTAFGGAKISTAQSIFGSSSLYVDGVNGSGISTPWNPSWGSGIAGDFTIEGQFYPTASGSVYTIFGTEDESGAHYSLWVRIDATGKLAAIVADAAGSASTIPTMTSTSIVNVNNWNSFQLKRSGSTLMLVLNGNVEYTTTYAGVIYMPTNSTIKIGCRYTSASWTPFKGYIAQMRWSNGTARPTAIQTATFANPLANNWNVTNAVISDGVNCDWLVDTPLNKYATLNPLLQDTGNLTVYKNNCMSVTLGSSSYGRVVVSDYRMLTSKWYAEFTMTTVGIYGKTCGVVATSQLSKLNDSSEYVGTKTGAVGYGRNTGVSGNSITLINNVWTSTGLTNPAAGSVIGLAFDADAGTLNVYLNGVLQSVSGFTGLTSGPYVFAVSGANAEQWDVNFGQQPSGNAFDTASGGYFKYTPPAGYKALCSANMS